MKITVEEKDGKFTLLDDGFVAEIFETREDAERGAANLRHQYALENIAEVLIGNAINTLMEQFDVKDGTARSLLREALD